MHTRKNGIFKPSVFCCSLLTLKTLYFLSLTAIFIHHFQIKEGAEKLREVATDRRSLNDVASIVKKSNNKIAELKSELSELESQILLTQGNSVSNGQGNLIIQIHASRSQWSQIFENKIKNQISRTIVIDNLTLRVQAGNNSSISCM